MPCDAIIDDVSIEETEFPTNVPDVSNANTVFSYPNPAKDVLYINTNSKDVKEVFNGVGQMLIRTFDNELDVSRLSPGLYFLRCGKKIKKVLIE